VQRRLFILFLLLSFLPAAVLLTVSWRMSQEMLSYLDGPGLRSAMESSLDLARATLEREKDAAQAAADAMAAELASPRTLHVEAPAGGAYRWRNGELRGDASLAHLLEQARTAAAPRRIEHEGASYLLVASGDLRLASPLDADLVATLDAVAAGGGRHRQIRGFYRELLSGDILVTLLLLGLVILLVALGLSRLLARQLAAPLGDLVRGTERLAAGDLGYRVNARAKDEVAELVTAFNAMGEQLEQGQRDLLRAERVAAWQGIARRLAHEIKNPLTPINLAMHRIEGKCDDPAVSESIEAVLEETGNLHRLADEFSLFARLPEPEPESVELRELVGGVIELYLPAERYAARWEGWPEALRLDADPGQLRQVLANLVKNAAEAMGTAGTLTLHLALEDDTLRLYLDDDGPGIEGDPEALFEPYVTSKAAGTGLGLAIARKMVEDHGGGLTAGPAPGGGARFTLTLPLPANPEEGS